MRRRPSLVTIVAVPILFGLVGNVATGLVDVPAAWTPWVWAATAALLVATLVIEARRARREDTAAHRARSTRCRLRNGGRPGTPRTAATRPRKRPSARAERPTAIFAGADIAALGVLRAAEEQGVLVPEDVTIAGYDKIYTSTINRVALTTIDQSGHLTGTESVRLLLERIEGRTEPQQFVVAPKLVIRRTSGRPLSALR